jgi:hypothetical protein
MIEAGNMNQSKPEAYGFMDVYGEHPFLAANWQDSRMLFVEGDPKMFGCPKC